MIPRIGAGSHFSAGELFPGRDGAAPGAQSALSWSCCIFTGSKSVGKGGDLFLRFDPHHHQLKHAFDRCPKARKQGGIEVELKIGGRRRAALVFRVGRKEGFMADRRAFSGTAALIPFGTIRQTWKSPRATACRRCSGRAFGR